MSEITTRRTFYLVLTIATMALYLLNSDIPFYYDDIDQIKRNPMLHDFLDWRSILNEPNRPSRPIQNLTFALNWAMSSGQTWSFHLFNDVFHLINTLLLFWLLHFLGIKERPLQFLASALFFIHPLHVESVTYVMGRTELLKTMVTLGVLHLYVRNASKGLIYLVLLLSLLIKETCLLSPLLFIAYDIFILKHPMREFDWKKHLFFLSHGAFIFIVSWLLPLNMHSGAVGFTIFPFWDYIITNVHYLTFYIHLFFNPVEQSIHHEWIASPPMWSVALGGLAYAMMIWTVFCKGRRFPLAAFMVVFFLISFGPNSTVLQFVNPFAEYRLYQSTIVLCFFLAWALFKLTEQPLLRWATSFVLIIYFCAFHVFYLNLWKHPVTLWSYAIEKYPHASMANFALGAELLQKNMCKNALKYIDRGCATVRVHFHKSECAKAKVALYLMMGELPKAFDYLQMLERDPRLIKSQHFYNMYRRLAEDVKNGKIPNIDPHNSCVPNEELL